MLRIQVGKYHNWKLYVCFCFKVILIVVSVCTATGAWNWLIDPDTQKVNICCQLKLVSLLYKIPMVEWTSPSFNKVKGFFVFIFGGVLYFVLQVSFFSSLWNHPFFTISCITLIALFFAGIHKRVVAPSMYPLSKLCGF